MSIENEFPKPKISENNNEDILYKNLNIENEIEENRNSENEENYPFRIIGDLQKKGNTFGFFNYRYAEIDVIKGLFKRFKSPKYYPDRPIEVINIKNITSLQIKPKKPNEFNYYFELKYKPKNDNEKIELYRTRHVSSRDKWFNTINEVYRYLKGAKSLPKINKNKLMFINDQIGITQEISKGDKIPKKNEITLDDFHIISRLGSGAFGTVYKVKCKLDNNEYALKVINKNIIIEKKYLNYMMQEFEILKYLNGCPFILSIHYAFQTANFLFMVTDLCSNGDISHSISISNPKLLISELILAIEYMHNKKVIYRDLKAENVLLNSEGHIKICDFNLSKMNIGENDRAPSFCGSPLYLSPEMLDKKGVNFKADIYQLGLLIYEILVGHTAYKIDKLDILYDNISHNRINFNVPGLDNVTTDLLQKILKKLPEQRLTIKEIKEHVYFNDVNWDDVYNKKCGDIIVKKKYVKKNIFENYEQERENLKNIEEIIEKCDNYTILNGKVTWKEIKKDIKRPMRNFIKKFYYNKNENVKNSNLEEIIEDEKENDNENEITTDYKNNDIL